MSAVELRVVGRRSGVVRSTMLTVPVEFDGSLVLVASKGGDDRDPDWFRTFWPTRWSRSSRPVRP